MKQSSGVPSIIDLQPGFVVINKPAGMLTIPDEHTPPESTLSGWGSATTGSKLWTVHRLDRDTTGAIVFARTAAVHADLCAQFQGGTVEKTYIALIDGCPEQEEGIIDLGISTEGRSVRVDARGKPSRTRYRVVEKFRSFSLIEAMLESGRRHQIRLHFAAIGYPLSVDPEHGRRTELLLSEIKRRYKISGDETPLLSRLSLHASVLSFRDPRAGTQVRFVAPLPRDLTVCLKQLRKYNAL